MPWATALANVMLPLRLAGVHTRRAARARGRGAGAGRAGGLREVLSARAVGRHEDARVDRAGAGDAAQGAADGRAVRGARRDHPPQAQRRPARAVAARGLHRDLRHPLGVRDRSSCRSASPSWRRGRAGSSRRSCVEAPYPRDARVPHLGARTTSYCRRASAALGEGDGHMADRTEPTGLSRCHRAAASLGLIVLGIWEGIVRAWNIPPYLLPGPDPDRCKTLVTDWSTLMDSLVDHHEHHARRAHRRGGAGRVRWRCCSPARNGSSSRSFPMR